MNKDKQTRQAVKLNEDYTDYTVEENKIECKESGRDIKVQYTKFLILISESGGKFLKNHLLRETTNKI